MVYSANIHSQGTSITSKIANTKYCNDRSIVNGGTITSWNFTFTPLGYGTNNTVYAPARRLGTGGQNGTSWSNLNSTPQYDCPNDSRDAFTLSISNGGTSGYGNNKLTYPIGLLTADELTFSGVNYGIPYNNYFLYVNDYYWTMSAFYYNTDHSCVFDIFSNGELSCNYVADVLPKTFPVISLKENVLVSGGDGHAQTPYVIQ